jgi:hypothetical protein
MAYLPLDWLTEQLTCSERSAQSKSQVQWGLATIPVCFIPFYT